MKHDGDQWEDIDGPPTKPGAIWNNMTDEDLIEFEDYMLKEQAAKEKNSKEK